MKAGTLKRQLFFRIVPTILITISIVGIFAFKSANREINKVYNTQMVSNANVLWMLVKDEISEAEKAAEQGKKTADINLEFDSQPSLGGTQDDYEDSRMFRIWGGEKLLVYSDTALPASIAEQKSGFSEVIYQNEKWIIYNLSIPKENISIEVGEKKKLRDTLVNNILLDLAAPLLLLIPVVGLLIWLGIGSGLSKIKFLVKEIRSRSSDDLSHLDIAKLPLDIMPLGQSINQLFGRLENSFTAEKRFSDHAAHQLRTPLSVIKLQLQMLETTTDEQEKASLVKELLISNERATKLIGLLLASSRISHQHINFTSIPLYKTTKDIIDELQPIAAKKNIKISLDKEVKSFVKADADLLKLLINNIIENAIKYAPSDGYVKVVIKPGQKNIWLLEIEDNGPGIPEKERQLVFERFYRIDTPEEEGSGLGLSIASEIIKRFSGNISLKTPNSGSGLLVEISLPAT